MGNNHDITAYLAWGYHTAALRGEAPATVSVKSVLEWLETRPIYQQHEREKGKKWAATWKKHMARLVYAQLESLGVIKSAREEVRRCV